ncbi:MAG: Dna2/Cas4 domain-containing protein [Candidatus Thermoplasmatota archaeon]|nr:Dna2/Cas4 domain-containing protein [Candidatus Thermoplasmatota archaeon]
MGRYSAADIEKFSYCHLNWLLSLKKDEMNYEQKNGIAVHRDVEHKLQKIKKNEEDAILFEQLVAIYSLGAIILSVVGLLIFSITIKISLISYFLIVISLVWFLADSFLLYIYLKGDRKSGLAMLVFGLVASVFGLSGIFIFIRLGILFGKILTSIAIIWIIGAIMALYFYNYKNIKALTIRKKTDVVEGKIVYLDDMKSSELMVGKKYPVSGRPDYVVYNDNKYIPVEIKTGRTPRGPLYSHIAQLIVYCMLIEDIYNIKPDYGIIKYPEKSIPIQYTDAWRDRILQSVSTMDNIKKSGVTHRNHRNINKCRYCSRNSICPEKLI